MLKITLIILNSLIIICYGHLQNSLDNEPKIFNDGTGNFNLGFHESAKQPQNAVPSLTSDSQATILSNSFTNDGLGDFNYALQTSNGISQQAEGQLKDILVPIYDINGQHMDETEGQGIVQKGSYSYTAPDGTLISVQWIADENGYQTVPSLINNNNI